MNCQVCRAPIDQRAAFCGFCGSQVQSPQGQNQQQPPQQSQQPPQSSQSPWPQNSFDPNPNQLNPNLGQFQNPNQQPPFNPNFPQSPQHNFGERVYTDAEIASASGTATSSAAMGGVSIFLGMVSMIFCYLAFLAPGFFILLASSIVGIVLGSLGISKGSGTRNIIKGRNNGHYVGLAGLITGSIGLAFSIIALLLVILFGSISGCVACISQPYY